MEEEWTFEHTIECSVSSEFAWDFWTNVSNWALDAELDSVDIQGPFVAGAQGVTQARVPDGSNGGLRSYSLEGRS